LECVTAICSLDLTSSRFNNVLHLFLSCPFAAIRAAALLGDRVAHATSDNSVLTAAVTQLACVAVLVITIDTEHQPGVDAMA
jgi:hypothetical protein